MGLLATVIFLSCKNPFSSKLELQKRTLFLMDTFFSIQVYGEKTKVENAIEIAFRRMEEINKTFNFLNKESAISRFNLNSEPIEDKDILFVIDTAIDVSRKTDGAFDITITPLLNLWGFYGDSPSWPKKERISQCLKNIGYKNIKIKNKKVTKLNDYIQIDLGGIAKGYAIDEAVITLKKEGIESALIDGGGDIYALGELDGKPWKVAIRDPRGDGIIGVMEISDLAAVTSGDYERFFMRNGKRYHHILNPVTGYPAEGLASVTIFSSNAIIADAWSTAIFVLGKEKGLEIAEKNSDIETVMVTSEGEIFRSSGLNDSLQIKN